jgi:hypothetical protein
MIRYIERELFKSLDEASFIDGSENIKIQKILVLVPLSLRIPVVGMFMWSIAMLA